MLRRWLSRLSAARPCPPDADRSRGQVTIPLAAAYVCLSCLEIRAGCQEGRCPACRGPRTRHLQSLLVHQAQELERVSAALYTALGVYPGLPAASSTAQAGPPPAMDTNGSRPACASTADRPHKERLGRFVLKGPKPPPD
jgi:hypothetical protein